MGGESRRLRLKQATAQAHSALDARVGASGFFTSPDRYRSYLAATLTARSSIEHELEASGVATLYADWPATQLAQLLEQDLADVAGCPSRAGMIRGSTLLSRAGMFGALYVL